MPNQLKPMPFFTKREKFVAWCFYSPIALVAILKILYAPDQGGRLDDVTNLFIEFWILLILPIALYFSRVICPKCSNEIKLKEQQPGSCSPTRAVCEKCCIEWIIRIER